MRTHCLVSMAFLLLVATILPARAFAQPFAEPRRVPSPALPALSTASSPTAASSATTFKFDPAKPIPHGYRVERKVSPLVYIGGVVFVPTYGLSLAVGVETLAAGSSYKGCPSNAWLVIPIAGPFLAQTGRGGRVHFGTDPTENARQFACEDAEGFGKAILAFDGILQGLGFVLFSAGWGSSPQVLVRDDDPNYKPQHSPPSEVMRWRVVPWHVGTSSVGVGLVGTF